MKYAYGAAALAAVVSAGPVINKRQAVTDVQILNYALTLEHLENKFYHEGLANFTQADFVAAGFADPFYENLKTISGDEETHVAFLSGALGDMATQPCTYAFGVTDPKSFVATSSVLEGVGVSAYLGAASFIMNKNYLTDAGSILTTEARHSAYIRSELMQTPFAQPFDNPLDFDEVYTLAAQFITSCPDSNPALPVKAFPTLTLGTTGPIKSGDTIKLNTPGYVLEGSSSGQKIYAAFITVAGPIFTETTPCDGGVTLTVPEGVNGQSYVVLTGCNTSVTDDTVAAGPAVVEISNY